MALTILDACQDPAIFQPFLKADSWKPRLSYFASIYALEMDQPALAIYQRATGRSKPPQKPFKRVFAAVGRRGGKSFATAILLCWEACFKSWKHLLGPGETGVVLCIAASIP